MADEPTRLRAVDLYSGVGGWSLGLKLAGVEVVASYDIWKPANETNTRNNGHAALTQNLRHLDLAHLPKNIDIVVGSPPCTQFSYANRGGGGDIEDGLKDIKVFLQVVDHLRPKAWAMENVPRVAAILDRELRMGGRLAAFAHLGLSHRTINMEDFGLPQRRKRCIAGNLDFDLLLAYSHGLRRPTLGDVITSLKEDVVTDPLYGIKLKSRDLIDHVIEDGLNGEEMRINRANKVEHPIYNRMPFPDCLDRSVRTITATCTRVSRESIVVRDSTKTDTHRRLTIRERATLQGFPITFQFFGRNYSQKLKMIGNAVPPLFSYYTACALSGLPPEAVSPPSERPLLLNLGAAVPMETPPARTGAVYPSRRTFRFAIPALRLSSGVRFDLTNVSQSDDVSWRVDFVFGTSKSIHKLEPGFELLRHVRPLLNGLPLVRAEVQHVGEMAAQFDLANMQRVWCHNGTGTHHPFQLLDALNAAGDRMRLLLSEHQRVAQAIVVDAVKFQHKDKVIELKGVDRLRRNSTVVAAGLLVGSAANASFLKPVSGSQGASAGAGKISYGF
ncbi:DNA cytosine methyltransferase [Mesorhizobium sp. M0041]|uniref:DNA cytosine methyltransferase n=1 Tax=Mesorhizobium sp. M0041 TaxID=2956856 RepID=UPI0033352F37